MKIFDVIYFNLFSYNIKILKEGDTHARTGFMLSMCEAFIINSMLAFALAKFWRIDF